jgi:hypothetical protein
MQWRGRAVRGGLQGQVPRDRLRPTAFRHRAGGLKMET